MIQTLGNHIGQQLAAAASAAQHGSGGHNLVRVGRSVHQSGTCAVPGCSRRKAARGLCPNHYAKGRKLGFNLQSLSSSQLDQLAQDGRSLRTGRRGGSARAAGCSVPGCRRPHAAKGLCMNHYAKAKRLKLNPDSLGASELQVLATDQRGLRS
jgi:hypothetical protein